MTFLGAVKLACHCFLDASGREIPGSEIKDFPFSEQWQNPQYHHFLPLAPLRGPEDTGPCSGVYCRREALSLANSDLFTMGSDHACSLLHRLCLLRLFTAQTPGKDHLKQGYAWGSHQFRPPCTPPFVPGGSPSLEFDPSSHLL